MPAEVHPVLDAVPRLAAGLGLTFVISTLSMALGIAIGLVAAGMRRSGHRWLQGVSIAYVSIFRGLPLITFLIWLYFGVTVAFGWNLSPIEAGIACLAIQSGSYLAEIFRAGLDAVPRTQIDAAVSLGLSPSQTYRDVVGPQAIRVVLPAVGNEYIGLVKGSALVSILGVFELMRVTQQLVNFHQMPFEFYSVAAVVYIGAGLLLGRLFKALERRLAVAS
jgi:His/Glu/Gln/Arg/opine family amino acid ABC transporter permease subunit